MIWKGLMVVTGSESPIVVVLRCIASSLREMESKTSFVSSGSMEPAFFRGDLLLLTNHREEPIRAGDIVVFRIEGRDIPIVHRVLKVHEKCVALSDGVLNLRRASRDDGYVKFLTKGDNNNVDDRGLYSPGQLWLEKKDVIGRARG